MKVKFKESFRVRMVVYTLISLLTAFICDLLLLVISIRTGFLVNDFSANFPEQSVYNNLRATTEAPARSMIGQNDVLYRIFGVSIRLELLIIMMLLAVLIFLVVFFLLTRRTTHYVDSIMDGVQRMSGGDFDYRIEIARKDEFSCIADAINQLADTVQMMQQNAQEAEQTKNELITNVAHDLRTPLTSIIGYIDIVRTNNKLTEAQKEEYLNIAWEKARKLNHMINDLFSFTKVSYGGMPMRKMSIDLIKLLEQEVDELYPSFEENGLKCYFEPDTDMCLIAADGEQLIRVFDNLLGNAIRYGKNGKKIFVRTKTEAERINVQIINFGSIIPAENLPYLFEKFYKVDSARQSSSEGTGLGLAIAKSIVESHGGQIRAASSFKGTMFEVTLPRQIKEGVKANA